MCYNQTGDISTLEGTPLKLVDKFTYLGSSVESTEKDIETRLTKAWTAINRLSIIWKSDLTDKMKRSFFQAAVTSILLYGCTTWTLTKRPEKKLDGNYTRMLCAILNKSWRQHPTRHQLYGHLPSITKTIQVTRARHCYIYNHLIGRKWISFGLFKNFIFTKVFLQRLICQKIQPKQTKLNSLLRVLPFCRDAVGVFSSFSWLDLKWICLEKRNVYFLNLCFSLASLMLLNFYLL